MFGYDSIQISIFFSTALCCVLICSRPHVCSWHGYFIHTYAGERVGSIANATFLSFLTAHMSSVCNDIESEFSSRLSENPRRENDFWVQGDLLHIPFCRRFCARYARRSKTLFSVVVVCGRSGICNQSHVFSLCVCVFVCVFHLSELLCLICFRTIGVNVGFFAWHCAKYWREHCLNWEHSPTLGM